MADTIQSVERAFEILFLFDEDNPSMSATAVVARSGLSKPTVYRFLKTLRNLELLRVVDGRYEIAPRMARLAAGFVGFQKLPARSQPTLEAVTAAIDEHCSLAVLDGDEVISVASTTSPHQRLLSIVMQVGHRLPAERSALGRVLLAHDQIQAGTGAESTSVMSVPSLRLPPAEVEQILADGYALVDGLLEAGLRSIAVPVRDSTGRVVAALGSGASSDRMSVDQLRDIYLPELLEGARRLTDLS